MQVPVRSRSFIRLDSWDRVNRACNIHPGSEIRLKYRMRKCSSPSLGYRARNWACMLHKGFEIVATCWNITSDNLGVNFSPDGWSNAGPLWN